MTEQETFDYAGRWDLLARQTHERLKLEGKLSGRNLHHAALHQALRAFLLECFSEDVRRTHAKRWAPLDGRAGAELKAVLTHHWLPQDVRQLSDDELFFALQDQIVHHPFQSDVYEAIEGMFSQYEALPHIHHLAPASED